MYYFILARRKTYKITFFGHDKIIIIYVYWRRLADRASRPVLPSVSRGRRVGTLAVFFDLPLPPSLFADIWILVDCEDYDEVISIGKKNIEKWKYTKGKGGTKTDAVVIIITVHKLIHDIGHWLKAV